MLNAIKNMVTALTSEAFDVDIQMADEMDDLGKNFGYIPMLEKNLEAGRIAYTNPMFDCTIANLRRKLHDLPPIDRRLLRLDGISPERASFNAIFEPYLFDLAKIIRCHLDTLRIPNSTLDRISTFLERHIQCHEINLEILRNRNGPTFAAVIQIIQSESAAETSEENLRLEQEIPRLKGEEMQLRELMTQQSRSLVVIETDRWSNSATRGFSNRHKYTYSKNIPFVVIIEDLEEGTRATFREERSPIFRAVYDSCDPSSSPALRLRPCAGSVRVMVRWQDKPGNDAIWAQEQRQLAQNRADQQRLTGELWANLVERDINADIERERERQRKLNEIRSF
jgi:hypothetical protein